MMSLLTLPALLANYERDHSESSRCRSGNALRSVQAEQTVHALTPSAALTEGQTRTKRRT